MRLGWLSGKVQSSIFKARSSDLSTKEQFLKLHLTWEVLSFFVSRERKCNKEWEEPESRLAILNNGGSQHFLLFTTIVVAPYLAALP